MSRLKVLLLITELPLGGAQKHVLDLAQGLSADNYRVHLAAGGEGPLVTEAEALTEIDLHRISQLVRPISPLSDLVAFLRLYRICRRERIDIVHTHCSKAGILGRWAARLAGVRVILHTVHGWGFYKDDGCGLRRLLVAVERASARITDRLITVSQAAIETGLHHRIGKRAQYRCVHHAIDPSPFQESLTDRSEIYRSLELAEDRPLVTMIACFKPQKAPLDFIEVAARVREHVPPAQFLIAGDGELRPQLEQALRRLGLEDTLRVPGWRRDIPAILAATDVLVLTSRWEGFPGALLEAMATGVPVVANAVGGVPEIVRDGVTGYLVEPGDIGSMSDRVAALLNDKALRTRMSRSARKGFPPGFELSDMIRRIEAIYHETSEARGRRSAVLVKLAALGADLLRLPRLLTSTGKHLRALADRTSSHEQRLLPHRAAPLKVAYLITDTWRDAHRHGGSRAHIRGITEAFIRQGHAVSFLTCAEPTFVEQLDVGIHRVHPTRASIVPEIRDLACNTDILRAGREHLRREQPSFIYHRLSRNSYAAAELAKECDLPLVVEYNGPIVWEARQWGRRPLFAGTIERVEQALIHSADIIVAVSEALRDRLLSRGVADERILVSPNAVNPEQFRPDVDGAAVRNKYHLDHHTVIGFAGTFGKWHGAAVLVETAAQLVSTHSNVRFLFLGDGKRAPKARRLADEQGVGERLTFTGMIPSMDVPAYLAACDILVSPQIPNPDGTPFFGSPTKLFEYMAMGKPIVASRVGQIGSILRHKQTGILVEPGDPGVLAAALVELVGDPDLRQGLGAAARREVVAHHTWDHRVDALVEKLGGRSG